ncbi:MAG: glutamyl-tRNA reductase [Nitrospirota bacterium]|jgi:glutamyl-tRNA reductase
MRLLVVGLNHKSAAVEVREKLAFDGPKLQDGLTALCSLPEVQEALVLSTCNRVEMYISTREPELAARSVEAFCASFHGIDPSLLEGALYVKTDQEAVRHAFRVAASLDSMVVGEPQILGQMKDAFEFALSRKATGVFLNKLMKKSISVAKRIRTETAIAENAVSISFAAVELARKIFRDLNEHAVMLLGAGEMAELAAKHLQSTGIRELIVANRTYERGVELAREMNGRPVHFESFLDEMLGTDIVICSTGAPTYVITRPDMHALMKERKQKPVFVIDISVPRNVDPGINDLPNVYLYDVDDLQGVVDTNVKEREKEAQKAEGIVEEEIETFRRWQASLDSVPTIKALREHAEGIKRQELERALNKMGGLGEKERKAVEALASAIVNKLIHPPTAALKEDAEDKDILIATIKRLYTLNDKGGD